MLQATATLIARTTLGPAQELTLHAPELVRALGPGQAVLIKCGWGLEPYLRRTFYPIAIDDELILQAQHKLAQMEGIFAAPESAATIAAAESLRTSGWLAPDEIVVCFNTGTGLKYI